jgi:hypothetical protein
MSLSHNINNANSFAYPEHESLEYRHLVQSVVGHYYADYIYRLREAGYSVPTTDYYYTYFGEYTPASFITDNRGYPVLRPGYNKRWLVMHHINGAVKVYIGRYVVVTKDGMVLFGDGVHGVRFPLDENGSIVAVVLKVEELGRFRGVEVDHL